MIRARPGIAAIALLGSAAVALCTSGVVVHAAAPRRVAASAESRLADAPPRLVLERIEGEPSGPLAFGALGLPPPVLHAAADRALETADWRAIFSVHVAREDAVAILGSYRVSAGVLWLVPAFPPEPGLRYRAVLRPAAFAARLAAGTPGDGVRAADSAEAVALAELAGAPSLVADLTLDARPAAAVTAVEAVHPGADEVPENLLRLYVHFTAPMSRGSAYRFVRLEDARGDAIELPFLELAEELWDRDGRRLTLLLDPGRIKLGLRPRQEEGPALATGHQVFLTIEARWPDALGQPLAASWRRGFRVGPADHDPIDPSRWRVDAPLAAGRDPLRVELDESLDHALLHRLLWIEDADGRPIAGSVETGENEPTWSFVPDASWLAGDYVLRVDRRLEDLAGNRVGRPFEVDLRQPRQEVESGDDEAAVSLPFTIPTRGPKE